MFAPRLLLAAALSISIAPADALARADDEPPEEAEAAPWSKSGEKAEKPKAEKPKAEKPKAEEPKAEESAVEGSTDDGAEAGDAGLAAPDLVTAEESTPEWGASSTASTRPLKGGGAFGLGFTIGTINGLSIKIWPHAVHGIVLHLGVPSLLNSAAVALSYRAHPRAILIPDSPVALHVNLGPVVRLRAAFDTPVFAELAGGVVVGLSVTVDEVPVELFFEVAPVFAGSISALGTGLGFGVDGLVGARFFF